MPGFQNPDFGEKPERPWYVEFFFDRSKPVALRATIAGLVALVLLYPLISYKMRASSVNSPAGASDPTAPGGQEGVAGTSTPAAASSGQSQTEDVKEAGRTKERPESVPSLAEEGSSSGVQTVRVIRQEGASIDPIFRPFPGLNPLFAGAAIGPEGDVWVESAQQVYWFQKGVPDRQHLTVKLDPSTFDQVDELPRLTALMPAHDGAIWAGAKDGTLLRYANYDWKVMRSAGEPFNFEIRALAAFQDRLYIGGQGVWKWDGAKGKISRFPAFLNVTVRAFAVQHKADGHDELLMAADNGVWRLSENGWAQVVALSGAEQHAQTLLDLGSEGILVGTGDGILRISPSGLVLERFIPGNDVTSIVRDAEGHLWVGTRSAGLKFWDGTQWYQYSVEEGFPGRNVSFLLLDSKGLLWIGVFGKGLFHAPVTQLQQSILKHQDSSKTIDARQPKVYSSACRAAVEEIHDGASAAVSLFRLDGKEYVFFNGRQVCPLGAGYLGLDRTAYLLSGWNLTIASQNGRREVEIPKEYPADQVKKNIFVDSTRRVWFGPVNSGPFLLNPLGAPSEAPRFQGFGELPEFSRNPTSFILEDKSGAIWVGSAPTFDRENEHFTAPPLHRYDGSVWQHFTPKAGLSSWMLQDGVVRKADGNEIAIVGDNGLSLIKKNVVEKVRASDALRKRFMYSIFEDRVGDLWVGHQFFAPGVSFYDGSSFHNVTAEQGLFSDRIIAISQDALDRMWLLASNGTVGIYPRSFFDRKDAEGARMPSVDEKPAPEHEKARTDDTEMLAPPADDSLSDE